MLEKHFTDNDFYTFTCQYYILQTYPKAEVKYTFFDRNNSIYPGGFGDMLRREIDEWADVTITEDELNFIGRKARWLPDWYLTYLRGYRFDPSEVAIGQKDGHLSVEVHGHHCSAIMWEMIILSSISELLHIVNGDMDPKRYSPDDEYYRAYQKGMKAFRNGLLLSDFGTRRRFSLAQQETALRGLIMASIDCTDSPGRLVGTSNVWLAKKYGLTPIGTMSHQIISFEECMSGVHECNHQVMKKWSDVYDGDLGIYLYDCFGDKAFFDNLSKKMAMMFAGLRVDSGDNKEQATKIMEKYKFLGIDPSTKQIVFSNALTIDKAIELHKWIDGRMQDSYGIGTHLMADVINHQTAFPFPYSNIVLKLTKMRINGWRDWLDCVKLSCDRGKTLGNDDKCAYLLKQLKTE